MVDRGLTNKKRIGSDFFPEPEPKKAARKGGKGSGESTSTKKAERWITFEATAYTALCDTGCTGVTATGYDVRNTSYSPNGYRVIAVDPSVIPLGALVMVKLSDGSTFKARAMDVGGAIKGNRIDLLVGSKSEAFSFGRQSVELRIIN